ncbi:MAG: hypothetical protein WDO73_17925 [Ignavibacteriota bacterium]
MACNFTARMAVDDVNEFIDGYEHEADMTAIDFRSTISPASAE